MEQNPNQNPQAQASIAEQMLGIAPIDYNALQNEPPQHEGGGALDPGVYSWAVHSVEHYVARSNNHAIRINFYPGINKSSGEPILINNDVYLLDKSQGYRGYDVKAVTRMRNNFGKCFNLNLAQYFTITSAGDIDGVRRAAETLNGLITGQHCAVTMNWQEELGSDGKEYTRLNYMNPLKELAYYQENFKEGKRPIAAGSATIPSSGGAPGGMPGGIPMSSPSIPNSSIPNGYQAAPQRPVSTGFPGTAAPQQQYQPPVQQQPVPQQAPPVQQQMPQQFAAPAPIAAPAQGNPYAAVAQQFPQQPQAQQAPPQPQAQQQPVYHQAPQQAPVQQQQQAGIQHGQPHPDNNGMYWNAYSATPHYMFRFTDGPLGSDGFRWSEVPF